MRVGILGAGQLGRMLALGGYPLGARFTFLDGKADAPGAQVGKIVLGGFDEPEKIAELARRVDVLTFDVENVPARAVREAGVEALCRPNLAALETGQDRVAEKQSFEALGIPVAPWRAIETADELLAALDELGLPAVLKRRRLGYDGRGQRFIRRREEALEAFGELGGGDLILEAFVEFEREVSMLGVRAASGETRFYPLSENRHDNGILRLSRAPSAPEELAASAREHVGRLMEHFDYVGVLAVEFFVCGGQLYANETAPRVHNSGHWTIEGAVTSQFENHIRAVLDLPLGDTGCVGVSAMANLIGEMPSTPALLAIPGLHLHDYGKSSRPGRKLGHATLVAPDEEALAKPLASLLALAWPAAQARTSAEIVEC
ncbi:MAG: 5-(carboxyamino)imidazole ribonucleotide synthase [Gammaproteobacteria bacterium]|nr:5-(carboxyamino)imidazole ribonucleotide synthase [Gammaproteobacteria bacterium]